MKFIATVSFLDPVEGITVVEADTIEDATKQVELLFQNRQNLAVVNVKELDDAELDDFAIVDAPLEKGQLN